MCQCVCVCVSVYVCVLVSVSVCVCVRVHGRVCVVCVVSRAKNKGILSDNSLVSPEGQMDKKEGEGSRRGKERR